MIRAFESPPPPPLTLAMLLGCLARALSRRVVKVALPPSLPRLSEKVASDLAASSSRYSLSQALRASGRSVRTRVKATFDCHSPLWGSSATDFSQKFWWRLRRGKGGRRGGRRQRRGPAFPASSARSSHPAPLADWNVLASQSSHAAELRGGAAAPSLDLRCRARLRGRANVSPPLGSAVHAARKPYIPVMPGMLGQ